MTSKGIGRRDLLAASGAGLLAAAASSSAASAAAPKGSGWDSEADIICGGAALPGMPAGLTARANGDSVIVLDKAPVAGGTTLKSGAAAWLPGNRQMGTPDNETDCLRYMSRYAYPEHYAPDLPNFGVPQAEYDLLKAFYANASPMTEKLRSLGALDMVTFTIPGGTVVAPDYAPQLPENGDVRGRTLWPRPADGAFGGPAMIGALTNWLEARKVPVLTEHSADALIVEDGRVAGIEVVSDVRRLRLRARKGVIFASGGFAHNVDLVRQHQPLLYGSCATPAATGDFVRIAGDAGAAMGRLDTGWRMQVVLEEAVANRVLAQGVFIPPGDAMILVNKYGRRVVNEKRNYNDRTNVHFQYDPSTVDYPNELLFMVFDQRAIDVFGGAYPFPEKAADSTAVIAGATWAELASKIQARLAGLTKAVGTVSLQSDFAATLEQTVKRFNGFARTGQDEDFHRGHDKREAEWQTFFSPVRKGADAKSASLRNALLHPFTSAGPYYAIILAPGALDTSGGPRIDAQARVLDGAGKPIPGLFGAGNCVASPTRQAYFGGGGTIGPAMTFGYIAANAAHGQA